MGASTPSAKARSLKSVIAALRRETGLSQRAFAEKYGIKPGTLGHWESGTRRPDEKTLDALLNLLEVSGDRRADILSYARGVDDSHWLAVSLPEQRAQLNALLEFERDATAIVDVSAGLIPGLLQTREYMDSIMIDGEVPAVERPTLTTVRVGRREVLSQSNAAEYEAFIGEAALNHYLGRPRMMARQLRHVLEIVATLRNVTVRVVPFSSKFQPSYESSFSLVKNADGPIVHVDVLDTLVFFHEPEDAKRYEAAADKVRAAALKPEGSLALIAETAERMEKMR